MMGTRGHRSFGDAFLSFLTAVTLLANAAIFAGATGLASFVAPADATAAANESAKDAAPGDVVDTPPAHAPIKGEGSAETTVQAQPLARERDSSSAAGTVASAAVAQSTSGDPAAREGDKAAETLAEPTEAEVAVEAEKVFRRIVHGYENMDPINAGATLAKLTEQDLYSVVRILLAMEPRKSGAVLDAISQRSPQQAGTITREMLAQASPAALTPAR